MNHLSIVRPVFLAGLLLLAACTKYPPAATANLTQLTLQQFIATDTSLHLYHLALIRAGMETDSTFAGGGPYTIFAGQDTAFLKAGLDSAVLSSMDTATLRGILQYGIVGGLISSQDLTGFYTEPVTTLNPLYEPMLTKNYYGIFLDGIPPVKANIQLGDGVMQETGRLLLPPTGTLLQEIDSLPELSFLAAAIHKNAYLMKVYSTPHPTALNQNNTTLYGITLLAPVNGAFQALGFPDTVSVQEADSTYMVGRLLSYTGAGTYYTSEFMGGTGSLTLYSDLSPIGAGWTILPDGFTFQSNANVLDTVRIIKPDITATNGVIQEINYMLFPPNQ